MGQIAFNLAVGLTLANFLWQVFTNQDWERALETSFFQCIALATLVFFL